MRPDDWHLTEDVDDFLARAGGFLRSRPAQYLGDLVVLSGAFGVCELSDGRLSGWLPDHREQ
jgi:hypothetical protein